MPAKIALIHVKVIDAADPPLGILYLAGHLQQNGFETRVWDEYKNIDFLEEVLTYRPDIVGFSVLSSQLAFVRPIIQRLKDELNAFIALGGIHPSVLPEDTLRSTAADAVVIGEGEATLLELAQLWPSQEWRSIQGIAYLEEGRYVRNCARELIPDLDVLPFPDYSLLKLDRVFLPPGTIRGHFLSATAHISTSRGCPNRCIYCNCPTLFGTKVRQRSPQNVVEEIKQLTAQYPVIEGIWFVDDTFTSSSRWVMEFCDRLIQARIPKLIWSCQTRVSHVQARMLEKMKAAGCVQVEYGIESGSDRVLKVLGKNTNRVSIQRAVRLAKEAGLDVFGTFMLGNPTETVEEMEESFALAKSLKLSGCRFFYTTPFPGTELYEMATKNGWLSGDYAFSESLSLRQTNPKDTTDAPLMVCGVPAETLIRLRTRFQNYFVFRNYAVYLKEWRVVLSMLWALFSQWEYFKSAIYYTWRSKRVDTFIEHVILAWRARTLVGKGKR